MASFINSALLSNLAHAMRVVLSGRNVDSESFNPTYESPPMQEQILENNLFGSDEKQLLFFPNGLPRVPKNLESTRNNDRVRYIRSLLTQSEITNSSNLPFNSILPLIFQNLIETSHTVPQPKVEYYSTDDFQQLSLEERKRRQRLLGISDN